MARLLFSETYTGERFAYGCTHGRGHTLFGVPQGYIVDAGGTDDRFIGGVWVYPAPLSDDDADRFCMVLLSTTTPQPTRKPRRWDNAEFWGRECETGYSFYCNAENASATVSYAEGDTTHASVSLLGRNGDGNYHIKFIDGLPTREALILAQGWVKRGKYKP